MILRALKPRQDDVISRQTYTELFNAHAHTKGLPDKNNMARQLNCN